MSNGPCNMGILYGPYDMDHITVTVKPITNYLFSIVLDAKVSIVTVSKLVDVAVTGNCKC